MRLASSLLAVLLPAVQATAQKNIDLSGKPDATIGEPFTMVTGVRELPGNQAIVTDQFERRLFIVDFAAGTRRQIGRQGDGPAEYRFPMAPLSAPGNKTWVLDASLRRLHVISADGSFEKALQPPYDAVPGGLLAARGTDAAGRVYFEGNSFNNETGRFIDSVAVIRWTPSDNAIATIGKVWSGGRVIIDRGGSPASVARSILPFPHIDAWAVLPDGRVAVVRHDPHQIAFFEGGTLRTGAAIPFVAIPVTAAERAAHREKQSSSRMTAAGGNQSFRAPPVGDAEFPATMPAFIATSVIAGMARSGWAGATAPPTRPGATTSSTDKPGTLGLPGCPVIRASSGLVTV